MSLNQILPPKERIVEMVHLDPQARNVYDSIGEEHHGVFGGDASTKVRVAPVLTKKFDANIFSNIQKDDENNIIITELTKSDGFF